MATYRLHTEPVNGRTLAVGLERSRSDPALMPGQVEAATDFVDMEDSQQWIDCFRLNGNIYEVNVCECLLPTIVCRTQGEDEPHTKAPSKTTNSMIEALKAEIGVDNYRIINELRKREDQSVTAQAGETAAADSLLGYSQLNATIPSFEEIIHDLDSLYKVNRIGNSLDIVKDLTFKAPRAQEVIGKIEKLAKLVQGGQVTIRDILMAGAIRDNISPGSQIALVNTMAQVDHEGGVRFSEFKSAFRQTFVANPPSDTFFGQHSNKTDHRDHSRDQRSRSRSKERRQDSRTRRHNNFSPGWNDAQSSGFKHNNARSGHTHTSFHSKGPGKTNFLIDTGAQCSCLGKKTFLKMGGNLKNLKTSKNSFILGDGPSTPSFGKAKITICGYIFSIDIVSRNVPGLIGIDILTRRYRSIFDLKLEDRKVIIDNKEIDLLGEIESHLQLPDEIVEIYERSKLPRNTTNMSYFQAQPEDDLSCGGSRGRVLPGEASPTPRRKTPEKGKIKTT